MTVEHFKLMILLIALGGLVVNLTILFFVKVLPSAWDCVRKWAGLPRIEAAIVALLVVCLVQYGATKGGYVGRITYDGGIKAGTAANLVSNDTITISWQRDLAGGVYVPDSAAVYIDYRAIGATNVEWGLLAQSVVGDWSWSGTLANATNYDYNVWAYYIPPEPVHTNGVWVYKTLKDRMNANTLPLRARVEVNGRAIATPKEERKDFLSRIRKVADYLYEIELDDTYPADAAWYYAHAKGYGGCSAVRRGGFLYRNYDWHFDFTAEYVVRMSADENRLASVGIASVGDNITEAIASSGEWTRYHRCLAGHMLDGINERGVVCEVNVCTTNGMEGWTGSAVHCLGAVRHVLDNALTARQGAEMLAERVYVPADFGMNFHYVVADATSTYVVENGAYHSIADGTPVTNHGMFPEVRGGGMERDAVLAGGGDIGDVRWTRCYAADTSWLSEFDDDADAMTRAKAAWASKSKEAHRGEVIAGQKWWQTVHIVTYDFASRSLSVVVQENPDGVYEFTLNEEE